MPGFVLRFGTTFGAGVLGAAVAAIPAAIRVAAGAVPACSPYNAWLMLTVAGVVPMVIAIVLLRGARVGLKAFGGPGKWTRFSGFVLWAFLEVVSLVCLGALLRAKTHHHALAGATFALVSLAGSVGLALVITRIAGIVSALPESPRRLVVGGGAVLLALAGAAIVRRFGVDVAGSGGTGATIVDMLAFFIVATFASRPEFVERRALALLGPPAAATVLVLGASAFRACPQVLDATKGHAPLYSPALEPWSSH